jgi:ADP-ribose pyrophosphatase YjhB (NUDIX family)
MQCAESRYDLPLIVVTCFVACGRHLLWMQREMEPKRGHWAIPGGYLEGGETLSEGAARELYEETGVLLEPAQLQLYMTGAITFINQVYVSFRAAVPTTHCRPGRESRACGFFIREDCPWDDVAYPEVNNIIHRVHDDLDSGDFAVLEAQKSGQRYGLRAVRPR